MANTLVEKLRTGGRRPGPLDLYFGSLSGDALRAAEETFFPGLQLTNGTFKTTRPHRLDEVNEALLEVLPPQRPLTIMDVAVSSGVSTAEWTEHLRDHGIDHRLTAGDLSVTGLLLTIGRSAAVLWQDDGNPLVVQLGNRSVYLTEGNPASRIVKPVLRRVRALAGDRRSPFESPPARVGARLREVGLVSRRLAPAIQRVDKRIGIGDLTLVEDDITEPGQFRGEFDVCRAANIVNRGYFPDEVIRRIAANLFARLRDGGLLIVCQTGNEDHITAATVFRRASNGAEIVRRVNGGCDVEPLLVTSPS
ncbi:MAG: hypothetical protein ACLPZR_10780 [Solirubrobacteraceae bacterium]